MRLLSKITFSPGRVDQYQMHDEVRNTEADLFLFGVLYI